MKAPSSSSVPPSVSSLVFCAFLLSVLTTLFCSGNEINGRNNVGGNFYAQGFVVQAPTYSSVRGGGVVGVAGPSSTDGDTTCTGTRTSVFLSSTTTSHDATTTTVSSWEELESELKDIQAEEEPSPAPLLTLYRYVK